MIIGIGGGEIAKDGTLSYHEVGPLAASLITRDTSVIYQAPGTGSVKSAVSAGGGQDAYLSMGSCAAGATKNWWAGARRFSISSATNYDLWIAKALCNGTDAFVHFAWGADGKLNLYVNGTKRATSTGNPFPAANTFFIEWIEIDISAHTVTYKVNNVAAISWSDASHEITSLVGICVGLRTTKNQGQVAAAWHDDFRHSDDTGTDGNTAPSPSAVSPVQAFYPTGNGTYTGWTGDYTAVDEPINPNEDTDRIESDGVHDDKETYTGLSSGTLGLTTVEVVCIRGRVKSDGVYGSITLMMMRQGEADVYGGTDAVAGAYNTGHMRFARALAPDGGAWTTAKFDALECGVRNNAIGHPLYVTCVHGEVQGAYSAPAAGAAIPILSDRGVHSLVFGGQVVQ